MADHFHSFNTWQKQKPFAGCVGLRGCQRETPVGDSGGLVEDCGIEGEKRVPEEAPSLTSTTVRMKPFHISRDSRLSTCGGTEKEPMAMSLGQFICEMGTRNNSHCFPRVLLKIKRVGTRVTLGCLDIISPQEGGIEFFNVTASSLKTLQIRSCISNALNPPRAPVCFGVKAKSSLGPTKPCTPRPVPSLPSSLPLPSSLLLLPPPPSSSSSSSSRLFRHTRAFAQVSTCRFPHLRVSVRLSPVALFNMVTLSALRPFPSTFSKRLLPSAPPDMFYALVLCTVCLPRSTANSTTVRSFKCPVHCNWENLWHTGRPR